MQRTGLSVTTRVTQVASAIRTLDQLGGHGEVYNRALAIAGHLQASGSPVASLEYVIMAPTDDPNTPTTIGAHLQTTDELYFLVSGEEGILTTNGHSEHVRPGDLVLAPRGTCHRLQNRTQSHLAFLVVEVHAPQSHREPTIMRALPKQMHAEFAFHAASVPLRGVQIVLPDYFSGPWGELIVMEIPPGGRLYAYCEERYDQNLFIPTGNATLLVEEEIRANMEGFGLNAFVPQGLSRGLINQCIRDPLLALVLNVAHTGEKEHVR